MSWRAPFLRLLDLGQDVHQRAPELGERMVEQLQALRLAITQSPTATVCLVTDGYGSGNFIEAQLQIRPPGTALPVGTRLYLAPPSPEVTPEMIREALSHLPFEVSQQPTAHAKWDWLADFLTRALADPHKPCPCCNVTPAGDILDHLPPPPPPGGSA